MHTCVNRLHSHIVSEPKAPQGWDLSQAQRAPAPPEGHHSPEGVRELRQLVYSPLTQALCKSAEELGVVAHDCDLSA